MSPVVAERLRQAGHDAVLRNLPAIEQSLQTGCVAVLEDARLRVRPLPVGGGEKA